MKFDVFSIFRKFVKKNQVSLKSDKNDGYFTWRSIHIFITSPSVLLRIKNVSDRSCTESQKQTFKFNNFFFLKSYRLWDNVENTVEPKRPQVTIWRTRIACWVYKATDTRSKHETLIAFPLQVWLHERAWMWSYAYIAVLYLMTVSNARLGVDGRWIECECWRLTLWPWSWTFKFQHTIYVKFEYFVNVKKGNIVKYTTFCRGINGYGASKSKKIIQYIVN